MSPSHHSQHDFPQVFEHMPAIHNVLGIGSAFGGSTRIFARTVTTDLFDAWVLPQPVGKRIPGARRRADQSGDWS
jgi:hypothetical protein